MQVSKWGNSLAVRLPSMVVRELGLREGDEVDLRVEDFRALRVSRRLGREEILKRLDKFEGMMPEDFAFDRDEANER